MACGIVGQLKTDLGEHGLDIVRAFPARSLLHVLGERCDLRLSEDALCVLVGNSKLLWEPFLLHLKKKTNGNFGLNPLDDFVKSSVALALDKVHSAAGQENDRPDTHPGTAVTAYYSNKKYREFGDNYLPIQRLAHAVGLAWLSEECHMCLHENFGPWFSLRALVVFRGVDYEGADPTPSRATITERGSQQLKDQLDRALQSKKTEDWIELRSLAARLVGCDRESVRYSEQQLSYHYYKQDKGALAKLLLG